MNGPDDEQHDAHVKCYRIAVAVVDGDAVEAAYDKHLAKALVRPMSATQLIEPTSSASAARGKTRRPRPLSFCLPPAESWRGSSPIQAAKSGPDRNTVGSAAVATSRPRTPMPGMVSSAGSPRSSGINNLGLGSSGKRI
jgi:hypothetical protein